MKRRWVSSVLSLVLGAVFVLTACQSKPTGATVAADKVAEEKSQKLVIYSGRSQLLVKDLLDQFSKQSGIQIEVRYDKSTQALANRLVAEGAETQADVFFAQDSGYLGALAKNGFLQTMPDEILNTVAPHHRDVAGHWIGTSGRARVLVYDPSKVSEKELPSSLDQLSDPRWKGKLGWAPGNSSFQAHVSALRHIWGEEKTKAWLSAVHGLEPKVYPKNSPQVKAVSNGEIEIGWVNHYYLHKLRASNPELQAANYSFRNKDDAGNVMMLSGIAITKSTGQREAALKLVSYLVSEKVQKRFAQELFEYPTHPGVTPHVDVPLIDAQMRRVDQGHLADVQPTLAMLRELQLL